MGKTGSSLSVKNGLRLTLRFGIYIMKAQQTRFPFILLIVMAVVGTYAIISVFVRTPESSLSDISIILVFLGAFVSLIYLLVMHFKQAQSIELTDDGVWSLVWSKPTRARLWPKLERTFLKWTDIHMMSTQGDLIFLYGPHRVLINTLYFKDANEVINFINSSRGNHHHPWERVRNDGP